MQRHRRLVEGARDLSSRTEQQAASLEQTSASVQELSSTVKTNADNAQSADGLADRVRGVVENAGSTMGSAVTAMSGIQHSARRVQDIIGVIDGISFQTNILALNAAVEAARAGEQGRGFAVVASEVRALAQRSSGAAKEIRELISASVNQIAAGAQQVEGAGATMHQVVKAVGRVGVLIEKISAATKEQSLGISQVNQAVNSLDGATQQNAALVEEAAAAASSLEQQAVVLTRAVQIFRL